MNSGADELLRPDICCTCVVHKSLGFLEILCLSTAVQTKISSFSKLLVATSQDREVAFKSVVGSVPRLVGQRERNLILGAMLERSESYFQAWRSQVSLPYFIISGAIDIEADHGMESKRMKTLCQTESAGYWY